MSWVHLSLDVRRARTRHRCDECGWAILPADQYEHLVGIYEGSFCANRTCAACVALRDEWLRREPGHTEWEMGELLEYLVFQEDLQDQCRLIIGTHHPRASATTK